MVSNLRDPKKKVTAMIDKMIDENDKSDKRIAKIVTFHQKRNRVRRKTAIFKNGRN